MKSKIYIVLLAASLSSLCNAQENHAINGDFENSQAGDITSTPWFYGVATGAATFTVIDSVKHSGSKSLLIDVTEKATGNYWDIQVVNEGIKVEQGKYYRATFWARSTEGFSITPAIGTYQWTDLTNTTVKLTKSWSKISLVCFNLDQDSLRVPINKFEKGQYYLDDLTFIESPIAGSTVTPSGDSIAIVAITNLEVIDAAFDVSSFIITVNGKIDPVTKVALMKPTNNFALVMKNKIMPNDTVVISHTGGKIFYYNTSVAPDDNIIAFTDTAFNTSVASPVAVKGLKSDYNIEISPNPASEFIKIASGSSISKVEVLSISGQLIKGINTENLGSYYVGDLPAGIYFIAVSNKNGAVINKKLIKL